MKNRLAKIAIATTMAFSLWGCVIYQPNPHDIVQQHYIPGAGHYHGYPDVCPYHRYYDDYCRYCKHEQALKQLRSINSNLNNIARKLEHRR